MGVWDGSWRSREMGWVWEGEAVGVGGHKHSSEHSFGRGLNLSTKTNPSSPSTFTGRTQYPCGDALCTDRMWIWRLNPAKWFWL